MNNPGNSVPPPPPPLLSKRYEIVDDPATGAVVSRGPGDSSFVVWNSPEFASDLLPKFFKHNNFSSFRQAAQHLSNKWSRRLINWKSKEIMKLFLQPEFKVAKLVFLIHYLATCSRKPGHAFCFSLHKRDM